MGKDSLRYPIIDLIRFVAIIFMIIFHLFWDLDVFKFVDINFNKDPFWFWFPRLIVTLFLIPMGMSMGLVYQNGITWPKVWKRVLKISFFAVIISIATYFAFPKNWIYFGTLHCIAACSLLALPFLKTPRLNLLIAIALPTLYWILDIKFTPLSKAWKIVSMDYIPIHPWLGMVLLGISLFHFKFHHLLKDIKLPKFILWCSKHSLEIYLVHQGVLYGVVYTLYLIFK